MNFLWTSIHSLFFVPGTHLCLRRWWKADTRCRRLGEKVMQSATEGQVSPPEQIQYGSYYIKEALMFPHCNTCFVVVHVHLLEKVFFFYFTGFHTSCPSVCDRGDAYDVALLRVSMSPAPPSSSPVNLLSLSLPSRFVFCYGSAIIFIKKKKSVDTCMLPRTGRNDAGFGSC